MNIRVWRSKAIITGGYVGVLSTLGLTNVISPSTCVGWVAGWCITDAFIALFDIYKDKSKQ